MGCNASNSCNNMGQGTVAVAIAHTVASTAATATTMGHKRMLDTVAIAADITRHCSKLFLHCQES